MFMGLVLFLFGMNLMGEALEKRAGNKLKDILATLTSSKLKGFFLGLVVTCVIQSSSATTVMAVGFVNSGIMTLSQAIPVIMGSNIGTTITAWILSLSGLSGDAWYISMLKPDTFVPILAVAGIVFYMFLNKPKLKDVGLILIGFATLMFGMDTMSGAVSGLKDVPAFAELLVKFENPILGVIAGAVITGIIQSSSASVGILQALAGATGAVTIGATVPIIMGQNIGTCVTAMISSVGANRNAKRTAAVHLYFNIIGTVVMLTAFTIVKSVVAIPVLGESANEFSIAVVHTAFNVIGTLLLFPFTNQLETLATKTVGNTKGANDKTIMLDERLITTPAVAITRCKEVVNEMSALSVKALNMTFDMFGAFSDKTFEEIEKLEDEVDKYEDTVGTYLVKLSASNLTPENSREVTKLLHTIGDLERLSDHAVNIAMSMQEMYDKKLSFSEKATKELATMIGAVKEITHLANECLVNDDLKTAYLVEPLEQVIDYLKDEIKKGHIQRLQKEECTIEMGFVLSDLITNLERVSDHCSNIAGCVIELAKDELSLHEYYHEIKDGSDFRTEYFNKKYNMYMEKYAI